MMKINSTIALIFSLALMIAPGANAQFGKLLGGDKDDEKRRRHLQVRLLVRCLAEAMKRKNLHSCSPLQRSG